MASLSPYVLPSQLISAPTGISWNTIPDRSSNAQAQLAEQWAMCWRATHQVESFCNQVLRSTLDTQQTTGPGRRMTVASSGVGRIALDQWPVIAVVGVSVCPEASFPRNFVPVPAGLFDIDGAISLGPNTSIVGGAAHGPAAVVVSPSYLSGWGGRNSMRVKVQYINGWPHAGITVACTAGATTLSVDDVTGFSLASVSAPVFSNIYDGGNTEVITITAVSAANASLGLQAYGPGTLTLSTGTVFAHAGPSNGLPTVTVSAMPLTIQEAAIHYATSEALVRGSTATTIPLQPGAAQSTGGAGGDTDSPLIARAKDLLKPYRRVF